MRKRVAVVGALVVISLIFLCRAAAAEGSSDYPRRPKLVVVVVIDQFRFDYLTRFRPQFVEGGFNLLLNGGANFVDCRYDYATTDTGPGHATLFTGAYGDIHGIIENEWYDRSLHRRVNCVADPNTRLLGEPDNAPPEAGASPRNLLGSTLGDELRAATNFQSHVISVSVKDRGAVLPGGHTANGAFWYDARTGHFVTSTYYMSAVPAWVARFNSSEPTGVYCGKPWQALPETPVDSGRTLKPPAVMGSEPCPGPKFLSWMMGTPYMNEIELNFAREAVRNERLGQGPATDMLAISLSINDYIGHDFGPYSPEVADTTLRTDRYLADFFADLDRLVGLANVWIALSADHGVAPTPKFVQEHNLGMGLFGPRSVRAAAEQALSRAFGEDRWVEAAEGVYIYLNWETLERHQVDRARAENIAAEAATTVPGVMAAYTRTHFLTGTLPDTPLARKAAHSFNPRRSGDVFLVLSPYAVASSSESGTAHGTPWNYDAQVPLVLWGSSFRPGVYATPCQAIDLAATLAAALDISQPSGAEGSPLFQAIK